MSLHNRKSLDPWILDEIDYYQHQIEGVRLMARMRSVLLADDMGLGKTLQVLTTFGVDLVRLTADGDRYSEKMLVVCPVSLKTNWAEEIEAFTNIPYVVLDGSPAARLIKLEEFEMIEGPKILIMNYELVEKHLNDLNRQRFDIAAFDEGHYLQNHKAKRTKACQAVYRVRTVIMTGSPMLNHVNGLWTILDMIEPGKWGTYWSFTKRYCVFGGFQDKQIIGVKNEQELITRLQSVMVRRLKEDVLDLPEVQYIRRTVGLTKLQRTMYDEVVEEMRLTPPAGGDPVAIENALTKFLRLKQICGTTHGVGGQEVDESEKLNQAVDDAMELITNGHKLVVFTQFRSVQSCFIRRLEAAIQKEGLDVPVFSLNGDVDKSLRQGIVHDWAEARGASVMVGMLQVIGVGLNMTAARHGMFLDKLFTPLMNKQAVDRLNRIGADTTQSIQIIEYRVRGTVESRVEAILRTKQNLFDNVVEGDNWKKKLVAALAGDDDDE